MTENVPIPPATEPLARLTEASAAPGQTLVRVADIVAVLRLLQQVAGERDTLRQMLSRG